MVMQTFLNILQRGRRQKILIVAIAAALSSAGSACAAAYAPWLMQIGVTDSVMSAANWGKGQLLGVVDTGIVANNAAFATGQVSSALSSCAAVTFKCPRSGFLDNNGHGTAVAAIAAGNSTSFFTASRGGYAVSRGSVISVAPNANILSEKVLNAQGSGYSTDVAKGVIKAADAGAAVINASISFGNPADIVAAINYAAAKGAFIVWAGGNDGKTLLGGANTSGLTSTAINHLIFAGSLNSKNVLSTFSDTPGAGSLVDASNTKTAYAARWAMAPGEAILAPYTPGGSSTWAFWSGTSMSTPIISGSLLLLQSAWPILKTKGTAANLLLATSTDMGAAGVDATYGNGLINLSAAFRPYGTLAVTQANGTSIAVSSLTGSLISGGALGSLAAVQSKLANYTAFDGYVRNFSVNLSGLIKSPSTAATTNPLPTNVNTGPTAIKLADGGELTYYQVPGANPADRLGLFGTNPEIQDRRIGYSMLTDKAGTTTAFGYGFPVQFSFARALFGDHELAIASSGLGVSGLSALAQGGGMFAYGMKLGDGDRTRIAVSYSSTVTAPANLAAAAVQEWSMPSATHIGIGLNRRLNDDISAAATVTMLHEKHGLLGSTYDPASPLNIGSANHSYGFGLSTAVKLDRNSSLLLESSFAGTRESSADGLFAGTTAIRSRSYGMTLMSKNLFRDNDRMTLSIKQPLRATSGKLAVVMPSVNEDGTPRYVTEWASLVPTGREVAYALSYDRPLGKSGTLSFQMGYRKDALNISGNNDAKVGAAWSVKF